MDISSNKCTPASNYRISKLQGTPSSVNRPSVCSKSSEKVTALLTPCRRVGLKRKSPNDSAKRQLLKSSLIQSQREVNVSTPQAKCLINESKQHITDINNDTSCKNYLNVLYSENVIQRTSKEGFLKCDTQQSKTIDSKPKIINLAVLESLASVVKEKKDRFKHIELSTLYEKKNDLQTLIELTEKWKRGCQEALTKLHQLLQQNGHTLTMPQVLAQFSIPHEAIGYTEDSDVFE